MVDREDSLAEVSRVRQKLVIALLLPVPFAALPLMSLLFSTPAHEAGDLAFESQVAPPVQQKAHPLAFGIADPSQAGCDPQSNQAIEG